MQDALIDSPYAATFTCLIVGGRAAQTFEMLWKSQYSQVQSKF